MLTPEQITHFSKRKKAIFAKLRYENKVLKHAINTENTWLIERHLPILAERIKELKSLDSELKVAEKTPLVQTELNLG